ncbi:MAG: ABC transporter permease [Acidobacteria bacterium]|nr:ABC transporter permease [Acidobacteriota bacterium]
MATQSSTITPAREVRSATGSAPHAAVRARWFGALPVLSLLWREIVRFYRQPSRVVGVIASPVLFWIVIGSGFGSSIRAAGNQNYLDYFFPGALIMIVLFTSIFTMMSVIEDRKEGFLLSVLVAPVSRSVIVLGKVLGGTSLSAIQGLVFLAFAPLIGIHFSFTQFLAIALVVWMVAFALTTLGFAIAWKLNSTQGFHAIINLLMIPLWLVSGALFPLTGASIWVRLLMRINPLTYGVEALRGLLFPANAVAGQFSVGRAVAVLGGISVVLFAAAFALVSRRSTKPAA